jgi:hypothetical protein
MTAAAAYELGRQAGGGGKKLVTHNQCTTGAMRYLVRDRIVIASVVQIALALMTGKAWAQSPPVYNPR